MAAHQFLGYFLYHVGVVHPLSVVFKDAFNVHQWLFLFIRHEVVVPVVRQQRGWW